MRSEARFAAMMPASRATPSTSPLPAVPASIIASVSARMITRAWAVAVRAVVG